MQFFTARQAAEVNKRQMQGFCRLIARAGSLLTCLVPMPLFGQPLGLIQLREGANLLPAVMLAVVALLAVLGMLLVRRRRQKGASGRQAYPDPPLVFPIPNSAPRAPAALPQMDTAHYAPPPERAPAPPIEAAPPLLAADGAPPTAPVATAPPTEEVRLPPKEPLTAQPAVDHDGAANGGEYVEGRTVRYYRPVDDTVQFLPGRLEIVEGEDRGQDIRFIRTAGVVAEITFGRSSGPPHRHVQLRARTVSRDHARLRYERDGWRVGNLSRTNPVVVNGEELHSVEDTRALSDGDLIEMGEVVFRFRER
ncbi:hypothetical protein BH24GEM3_BH24GEM3_16090 [soil metagenome]